MPNDMFMSLTSGWQPSQGVPSALFFRGIPIFSHKKLIWWMFYLLCVSHYVSSYCDHYYYGWLHPLCTKQHQVRMIVPSPQSIPRDTVKGSVGLTSMLQQQKPHSQMSSQAYSNYALGPLQLSPTDSLCHMLLYFMVFTFCFFTNGGSSSGFCNTTGLLLFQAVFHLYTFNCESVVGTKPDDSGVVILYQTDEFIHAWLAECFIAWSHIYPCSKGKGSTLTNFLIEPGWENYFFFGPGSCRFWAWSWLCLHRLCWHTITGCIFWWGCCHAFFSHFMVSVFSKYYFQ